MQVATYWQPNGICPIPTTHIVQTRPRHKFDIDSVPVQRIFDVICTHPGSTAGDLIKLTKNQAASEYARALMDSGDVIAIYKRTKPAQNIRGVRHFYAKGAEA